MGSVEHQISNPLLQGSDESFSLSELSSSAIDEFLGHRPVALRGWLRLAKWESGLLWFLSGASIVVSVFNYMLSFVTLMFTGHLGALELPGASIASVGSCWGWQVLSKLFVGKLMELKDARPWELQRVMVLHFGAAVILTFFYWYSGSVLKLIGQSDSIAEQGQVFARGLIPQIYAFAVSSPMQRFLQAQNIVNPLAYIF